MNSAMHQALERVENIGENTSTSINDIQKENIIAYIIESLSIDRVKD